MTGPLVVAIDGPSGVGKSTVGKELARRLGIPYLDTGAMYRTIGLLAERSGVTLPIADPDRVVALAARADVRVTGTAGDARTYLDGEDVSAEIRRPSISLYASAVSAIPGVRRQLASFQRRLALSGGGVLEGRDIGTKVVPETPAKFFLDASLEVRARRRHLELEAKGKLEPFEKVRSEMEARDLTDSTRSDSPLRCDESYVRVDTSNLNPDEVVQRCLSAIGPLRRTSEGAG
jgi:cytidylate kinase